MTCPLKVHLLSNKWALLDNCQVASFNIFIISNEEPVTDFIENSLEVGTNMKPRILMSLDTS